MTVVVRQATAKDVNLAVPLLLEAGEHLLVSIFGNGEHEDALGFLHAAWLRGLGQYGFANHWLACHNNDVVGIISCWHDHLPDNFDRDTLLAITDYYGLDMALDVVMRSQQYSVALNSPMALELCIGHIAVAAGARRMGVGTAMIRFMEQYARELGKLALVLDVEQANEKALAFYYALGFREQQAIPPFIQLAKGIAPLP
ncbi:GNAT family N-acetyltransferase [Alteromonas sp. C1M14]|uniref:GNAT family N-acetyltransferase n=1 Tax=Alteromonas sp. C1M14 TaxID=2841567 RepID=UPI001C082C96|nr:GNAT family N-acetyltransferase [Alteromonas sp. C1M14]MBU2978368.1 GNAT family N-acetyltransferase [Alteromonas sp. C1M14]